MLHKFSIQFLLYIFFNFIWWNSYKIFFSFLRQSTANISLNICQTVIASYQYLISLQLWSIPIRITKVCSQFEHSCDIYFLPVSPNEHRWWEYKLTVWCYCIETRIPEEKSQDKTFLQFDISTFILYLSVYLSVFFSGIYVLYHHYRYFSIYIYVDKKTKETRK